MPPLFSGSEHQRDLAAIGEVMAELAPTHDGLWRSTPAGDVFNVLVGAARLGLRCSFISAVGADGFTPMIAAALASEEIDSGCVVRNPARQNGIYTVESDASGERSFHYWRRGSAAAGMLDLLDLDAVAEAIAQHRALLVSGVTLAIVEHRERLVDLVERAHGRTQIVLDTNYRSKLWESPEEYRGWWSRLLPFGSVVLPSWDDLAAVYGRDRVEPTLIEWSKAGSRVIVKRGAQGCGWIEDGRLVLLPAQLPERLVDTAGAGDAFDAGVIAGLLRGETVEGACALGQREAVQVLAVQGAVRGRRDERMQDER